MQHRQCVLVTDNGQSVDRLVCRFTIQLSRHHHEWTVDILEFEPKNQAPVELYRHGNHALVLSEYYNFTGRLIKSPDWHMARLSKSPDGKTISTVFEYQGDTLWGSHEAT